jgi:type I restriction enzyme M protein
MARAKSSTTTRRLAVMNLALRGMEADFGPERANTFRRDLHPDLRADYVLASGSMSSNQSGEGDIRRALIEADLVDCMVALPGQLFYSTQIPGCLWFLAKNKNADAKSRFRDHPQPIARP